MKKVELLAPVGSFEALVAAVQNGADAVYLGGKKFGARQYANNFDEDTLIEAVEYCHIRGVKVYVTINTLVSNDEFEEFMKYVGFLYDIDVDAVIIQDLGVLKAIKRNFPDFEIHASTQMTIHNLEGIKLLKDLGVKRTVLAREMKLRDIEYIKENSDMEIEVFIHGALCICYSGQCLMSSLIGGRSGNRGRCAQPCRLPYKLLDIETKKEIQAFNGDYILSPRDLNTIEDLDRLLKLGIESLKIEGRMKRPEYVATVVKAYRNAIDMYYRDGRIKIDHETKKDLLQIFNRKFTKGHIFNETNSQIMGYEKPGNRGVEIGHVIAFDKEKQRVKIKLSGEINIGDGIEIRNSKTKDNGTKVRKIFKDNKIKESALKGEIVEIELRGQVHKGDRVFKTSDSKLLEKAAESYRRENKIIPISAAVKGRLGEVLELYICDDNDNYVSVKGKQKIEKAINRPLSKERIIKQLKKLGNTPYSIEKAEIDIDENISIPIGEINSIRREAIDNLNDMRKRINNRRKTNIDIKVIDGTNIKDKKTSISLAGYVNNLEQLKAILTTKIDIIYYSNMLDIHRAYDMSHKNNKLLIPALSRITNNAELDVLYNKKEIINRNKHILLSNHGQLNMFKDYDIDIHADFSFNIFNSLAAQQMSDLNVSTITLSPELNFQQLKDLISKAEIDCEMIVYGHLPMMITEYCLINILAEKNDKKGCGICKNKKYGLKDRYGLVFPLQTDTNCRTQILNSKKLFLIEYMKEIINSNVGIMRLQFTNEDKNEIISIVKAYNETLARILKGQRGLTSEAKELIDSYKNKDDYTKGHFSRGVI
ncbi:DUF3656 domain-containing U32 family peptidase [Paramaledivibacter caminithermalis]|uniref:Putative protease n=1 Tax=Paramaledivibacter caminithermalis (strain DSM 15212 / CIP 107654 / DViRD3) TaxID=1121301 RepID=A0A1M6PXY3_PARC5|nr:U32 family peptidase [Paramaledivibacter caminithermalis]SHK12799.1 putative protease [Paramaledivibacter caminithermalis DSM 15212]